MVPLPNSQYIQKSFLVSPASVGASTELAPSGLNVIGPKSTGRFSGARQWPETHRPQHVWLGINILQNRALIAVCLRPEQ